MVIWFKSRFIGSVMSRHVTSLQVSARVYSLADPTEVLNSGNVYSIILQMDSKIQSTTAHLL